VASVLPPWTGEVVEVVGDGSDTPWPKAMCGRGERMCGESQAGQQGSHALLPLSSELPCPSQLGNLLTLALISFQLMPLSTLLSRSPPQAAAASVRRRRLSSQEQCLQESPRVLCRFQMYQDYVSAYFLP